MNEDLKEMQLQIEKRNMEEKNKDMTTENFVDHNILQTAKETKSVKDIIDLGSTAQALKRDGTLDKLVDEKTDELVFDATSKKVEAETKKINEEVKKVKAQADKEIAELDKAKKRLEGEIAELKAMDDKSKAFFESNKGVLKTIGIREKMSLRAMQWLMIPAGIVFTLFQILLLPFSLIGFAIEQIMNIVDAVCGKIVKAGWKVALSILLVIVVLALVFGIYWVITHYVVL